MKTAYKTIRTELAAYDEALAEKPEIVVLNKIDALTDDEIKDKVKVLKRASKAEVLTARASPARACEQVLYRVISMLDAAKAEASRRPRRARPSPIGRRDGRRARPLSAADHQDRLGHHRRQRRPARCAQRLARRRLRRGSGRAQGARRRRWSSSPRAPSRSGAACSGSSAVEPVARTAAGRRQRRPDRPEPGLGRKPRAPRHRHRPDPHHAQYHRGAPLLPQRPHHHHDAARARRHPDHQRERFRRDRRDPLWRQ